jgi:esterase/lipase
LNGEQSKRFQRAEALALAAWDLARKRRGLPDTPRGQVMNLRAHQKMIAELENELAIPMVDRSFLRVKEGARESCLLIPGVSTGPEDLQGLGNLLFDGGFNVYTMRLPEFGNVGCSLREMSWQAALQKVWLGLRLLSRGGGRIHVVGLGFGATLALHLASKENVSSLVLLSPSIMPREKFWQRLLVKLKLHRIPCLRDWLDWNTDLIEGMDKARSKIGQLKMPIYAAQCEDDDRACPVSLRILQGKARHKASRFRIFPEGGHAILDAHGKEYLNAEILNFLGVQQGSTRQRGQARKVDA